MGFVIKSYPGNNRVFKSLIAAKICAVEVATADVNMRNGEIKAEAFTRVNPFGKVPTLFVSESDGVFESNSILRYIARVGKKLYGKDDLEASKIDAFLDTVLFYDSSVGPWIGPLLGFGAVDEAKRDQAKATVKTYLSCLNKHLAGKEFLVGKELSIADIALTCALINGFKLAFDAEFLKDLPEVTKWFKTNLARKEFHEILGDVPLLVEKH